MPIAPSSPPGPAATSAAPLVAPRARRARWASFGLVIAVALALWWPRLSGPLDLRFDAGVYYLLGTSVSTGQGYRIINEPGAPVGIQYPPVLPLLVAAHQWALGTTEPVTVATAMRGTYFVLFLAYAGAVLLLALRWLPPLLAAAATVLSLLSLFTYFLSDLLFAELPFALVSVVFVLVATRPPPGGRGWVRDGVLFLLGATGFFLRTAGLALFAAWTFEALLQRRWRAAALRLGLALVPFALWQGHVMRVQRSAEFQQPAYAYQRAPYQFYNVSYGSNVALLDPFQPELGRAGPLDLARRVLGNVVLMPQALAESVTLQQGYWRRPIGRLQYRLFGDRSLQDVLGWIPVAVFMVLVPAGIVLLFWRGGWLETGLILASVGLVCLTPWPGQFLRYLSPLTPFLAVATVTGLAAARQWAHRAGRWPGLLATGAMLGLLLVTFAAQTWVARRLFQVRAEEGVSYVSVDQPRGPAFFFHDESWRSWERAVEWIGLHSPADAIVASASPHLIYLRTGRRSVMPPMVADPHEARRLLEDVPVSYVIVDGMGFIDISRRYALPALESAPEQWQMVHESGDARVYARRHDPGSEAEPR